MSEKTVAFIVALVLILFTLTSALATSFVQECTNDTYRNKDADVVFFGVVTNVDTKGIMDKHKEITFAVDLVEKGNVSDTYVLTQPAGVQIPSITLDWQENTRWRIQAKTYDGKPQLVCGEFGRQWAMGIPPPNDSCAQILTHARNPATGDIHEFFSLCAVPAGWEITDAPQAVIEPPQPPSFSLWKRITNWFFAVF